MKRLLSFPPISFTLEAFSTYGRCGVAQAAAALSYFLILTLFPLLMCVNYFIGLFHLSLERDWTRSCPTRPWLSCRTIWPMPP